MNRPQNILEERKAYNFKILKKEEINKSTFYILRDPYGTKHMMVAEFYNSYKLLIGEEIKCYVDKINCRGKIFLEPDHPYYKINKVYNFTYKGKGTRITKKGKEINVIFVEDKFNREFTLLPNNNFQFSKDYLPDEISCKVERIKKGKLHLINLDFRNSPI